MEIKIENDLTENRGRERSPVRSSRDRNEVGNDSDMSDGEKDLNREKYNDRSRRGERSSRARAHNSSASRDRGRGGKSSAADRRIFVSNIAYEVKRQELRDLFNREVGDVAYVDLFTDEVAKPRGCGIIEFESPDSVKKAVEKMHRYAIKGRSLVVKEDNGVERDKYGRPQKSGGRGAGGGGRMRDENRSGWDQSSLSRQPNLSLFGQSGGSMKTSNTYGLSPQFLNGLGISGPLGTRVFVANLNYKADEKKLKEVFKLAGKVVAVTLTLDSDGKSRGFGVVEYDHPVEAVQAISMFHNQMLYDRKMTVRLDKVDHHKPDGTWKLPEGLRSIGMGLGAGGIALHDVARSVPNSAPISSGLVGDIPVAAATGNLGAGLGVAAALSNVVGLGSTGAALQASLAGVGGLGAAGLMGGAAGDIGLGANPGAMAGSALGGALGSAASGLGTGLGGANLGVGNVGYGSSSQAALGSAFPGGNRDFDALSAALGGAGGVNSGYNSAMAERDYRGSSVPGNNYANGPSRGGMGMAAGSGGGRKSDTVIVKNLPPSITWQALRDKFRDVGEVLFAEMRGKDIGLIRFRSEWCAERAVHMMDRSRIDGHTVEVALF